MLGRSVNTIRSKDPRRRALGVDLWYPCGQTVLRDLDVQSITRLSRLEWHLQIYLLPVCVRDGQ